MPAVVAQKVVHILFVCQNLIKKRPHFDGNARRKYIDKGYGGNLRVEKIARARAAKEHAAALDGSGGIRAVGDCEDRSSPIAAIACDIVNGQVVGRKREQNHGIVFSQACKRG